MLAVHLITMREFLNCFFLHCLSVRLSAVDSVPRPKYTRDMKPEKTSRFELTLLTSSGRQPDYDVSSVSSVYVLKNVTVGWLASLLFLQPPRNSSCVAVFPSYSKLQRLQFVFTARRIR